MHRHLMVVEHHGKAERPELRIVEQVAVRSLIGVSFRILQYRGTQNCFAPASGVAKVRAVVVFASVCLFRRFSFPVVSSLVRR